jgi:hypothetical protein
MTAVFTLQNRRLSLLGSLTRYVLGWQAQGGCAKQLSAHRQPIGRVDGLSARGETVGSGTSEVVADDDGPLCYSPKPKPDGRRRNSLVGVVAVMAD